MAPGCFNDTTVLTMEPRCGNSGALDVIDEVDVAQSGEGFKMNTAALVLESDQEW
jgi:hypothetical protein